MAALASSHFSINYHIIACFFCQSRVQNVEKAFHIGLLCIFARAPYALNYLKKNLRIHLHISIYLLFAFSISLPWCHILAKALETPN